MAARRSVMVAVCLVLFAGADRLAAAGGEESEALAKQRREMQHRQRRIIYNNDGCDIFPSAAKTPQGFLAQRMEAVPNSQVDSVFYCTGATVMFSHDAKVGETYGRYPTDRENIDITSSRALITQGTDTLKLVVDFCKLHDLEVFFTHRINDIHDSMASCDFELATWKREHPEYCLGKQADQGKYKSDNPRRWWSGLDFEIAKVREYLIAIVADVCRRYDIDGYEIDYFRAPLFFRPNLDSKLATEEQVAILTGFQRRVREVAYREGTRRGRPILVAARVPMTAEKCRHVGIDIERWLKDDLLDVLTTGGGYVPFTMPTRELVELGHAHGVPVYPTISASGMRRTVLGRRLSRSIKGWRGAAANAWQSGADGVYLFNTFPKEPMHPHFTELGDPESLRYADKVFAIDDGKIMLGCLSQAVQQSQILPVSVPAQGSRRVVLPIGEDIAAAAQAGRAKRVSLRVSCEGLQEKDALRVRMNGVEAPTEDEIHSPGRIGGAIRFVGTNVLSAGAGESIQITDEDFSLSLWVKTKQKEQWSGFVVFVEPSQDLGVKLYWNMGRLNIQLRRDGWNAWDVRGGERLLDGAWHHYAVTFDRDAVATVYLDGEQVSRRDITDKAGSLGTKKVMLIGTGNLPFDGFMDDLRLYRRALSEQEVQRIAKRPGKDGPVRREDLMGWWTFDEAAGEVFADASGNGNDARPKGTGRWLVYAPDPGTLRQGDNDVVIVPRGSGEGVIKVTAIELQVEYDGMTE